ncbi:hypothetical protein AVEN_151029-1 [Araneus ventricosus]|uniref:Peptidase A9 domain-containing protein n=1 Tax=Araneus ventricosus TaxID=182803 RepID=A0A4Y2IA25_ARAVE|nr:hypothetical protein AVEN_151029-1 [Araneus ventricosus]
MYGRLARRRLPFLNKAPEEGLKVSALCGGRNELYLERSICGAVVATCEPVVDIVARPQEFSESLRLLSILENLDGLNEEQRATVRELLQEFQVLFCASDSEIGRWNMTQHRINTGNHPPINQYPRRLPLAKKEEAERLVKEMVYNGIIEESSGPWALPIVLVKKKDGRHVSVLTTGS